MSESLYDKHANQATQFETGEVWFKLVRLNDTEVLIQYKTLISKQEMEKLGLKLPKFVQLK